MSEEGTTFPDRGIGLLRTGRNRSYGSLVRSPISPVRHRRIEHKIQPGETLPGLALKYGVSVSAPLRSTACVCATSWQPWVISIANVLEKHDAPYHARVFALLKRRAKAAENCGMQRTEAFN